MFRKKVETEVELQVARKWEKVLEDLRPMLVQALRGGHTELATLYLRMEKRQIALKAAYTRVVGGSAELSEQGARAYFESWHNPKPEVDSLAETQAVRELLARERPRTKLDGSF